MPQAIRSETIEPVTPEPARPVRRAILTQSWLDLTFLHWTAAPEAVRPLLPRGTEPDVIDGQTYIGLIAFRMYRIGMAGLPGLPWLGTFPETNVRLYSVDAAGRRGVVFLSLDAVRLFPVLTGRIGFGLPYIWSRMSVRRTGDVVQYTSRRHRPGNPSASSHIRVRIGGAVENPTPVEHFVTARWGLHSTLLGHTYYLPNEHPRWPLFKADVLELRENLIAAADLPVPTRPPDSVLYSPGVAVRFGAATAPLNRGPHGNGRMDVRRTLQKGLKQTDQGSDS